MVLIRRLSLKNRLEHVRRSVPAGRGIAVVAFVVAALSAPTIVAAVPGGLDGDFNLDGVVNGQDLLIFQREQGRSLSEADFSAWKANYGAAATSSATTRTPEPTTAGLAAAGWAAAAAAQRAARGRHRSRRELAADR